MQKAWIQKVISLFTLGILQRLYYLMMKFIRHDRQYNTYNI